MLLDKSFKNRITGTGLLSKNCLRRRRQELVIKTSYIKETASYKKKKDNNASLEKYQEPQD